MNVLWIEDFGGSLDSGKNTLNLIFGSLLNFDDWDNDEQDILDNPEDLNDFCTQQKSLHSIYLCRNYFDYAKFKQEHAITNEIDAIIIDIRLDNGNHVDLNLEIPAPYENKAEFHKNGGFYIFNDLIHLGVPVEKMCFMTGEDSTFREFQKKCTEIYLPEVKCFEKDTKGYDKLKIWLSEQETAYTKLRRGIIEGCRHLKKLSNDKYRFNKFIQAPEKQLNNEVLSDYLEVLENFLPLRKPENTEVLYKLFIRTLAHEWEATKWESTKSEKQKNQELYAFYWIMRMTRNWSAHSKIFEQLTSQDVAYLFIINMRTMFDLGETLLPYEKHLLRLFTDVISAQEMEDRIGDHPSNKYNEDKTLNSHYKERQIPLIENYAGLLDKMGNTLQAINFHDALNNLQKNPDKESDSNFFIKGLYQSFWFLTSTGRVYLPRENNELHFEKIQKFSVLNYQFKYIDYKKPEYLFEIARHIYNSSFPEA